MFPYHKIINKNVEESCKNKSYKIPHLRYIDYDNPLSKNTTPVKKHGLKIFFLYIISFNIFYSAVIP